MTVESFVFYTSWLDAIRELDPEDQLDALMSIMNYQAYHIEADKELSGPAKAIYYMAKPVADNLYQRRKTNTENGKKGGRPRSTKSNEELEDKVTEGNPKKNRNKTETKPMGYSKKNLYENENDNGNENGNRKKEIYKESFDCSPEFAEALEAYMKMRKAIRKPITEEAKPMILAKLEKLSKDEKTQIEILNQSTMNSWQGLFPLKAQETGQKEKKGFEALMQI